MYFYPHSIRLLLFTPHSACISMISNSTSMPMSTESRTLTQVSILFHENASSGQLGASVWRPCCPSPTPHAAEEEQSGGCFHNPDERLRT